MVAVVVEVVTGAGDAVVAPPAAAASKGTPLRPRPELPLNPRGMPTLPIMLLPMPPRDMPMPVKLAVEMLRVYMLGDPKAPIGPPTPIMPECAMGTDPRCRVLPPRA